MRSNTCKFPHEKRLSRLVTSSGGNVLQDLAYVYDNVGNITYMQNNAGTVFGLGGNYSNGYLYDNLYRLNFAAGSLLTISY